MSAQTSFSFDGRGINGADEFRSRLATLTEAGHKAGVGPLLAAAPDLLAALKDVLGMVEALHEVPPTRANAARAAIAKAEGTS